MLFTTKLCWHAKPKLSHSQFIDMMWIYSGYIIRKLELDNHILAFNMSMDGYFSLLVSCFDSSGTPGVE